MTPLTSRPATPGAALVRATLLVLALALALPTGTAGAVQLQDTESRGPLRVYLDCQTMGCDPDFFRTELTWMSSVRDRQDASVHVLITSQLTGGGGRL